jgi:CheY-like chemotaxis protein
MKTILVVEDEFAQAEGIVSILSEAGYRLVTARDGRQGLQRFHETKPDLLLVDFMMPLMNGAEMIREVRKDGARNDQPIVLMSAAHEHILKHYYTGYDAYLKKPFTKEELLALLLKLLPVPNPEVEG